MNDAGAFLKTKARAVETALRGRVDSWTGAPPALADATAYSLFAGGKRLRPALALGACEMVSGDDRAAMPAACALEMVHTYSLIHDDLPAMDNDALRRGQPTLHTIYGEATAILAGDALLTMAFEAAAECGRADVVRELARAAGIEGMAGGQQLDMEAEGHTLTVEALQRVHAKKTGALIRAAVRTGALLGGADNTQLDALTRYGEAIGLAFQITDDILNVTGSEAAIGKPVGSDASKAKSTYPALLGLDAGRARAAATVESALESLEAFGTEAESFRALARYITERDR